MGGMPRSATVACLAVAMAAGWASGCEIHEEPAQDEVVVRRQPPPDRGEDPGAAPGAEYLWIRGHWVLAGPEWTWRRGHWETRRAGSEWVPGRWVARGGAWQWSEGHWQEGATPSGSRPP